MKRGRARLIVVAGIVVGLAVMAEIGKDSTSPLIETASPPAPLRAERGESTLTPLEAEVTALVGVRGVGVVISTGGIVYMEIDVLAGYAAQPFAEALLEVAQRHGTVEDFSVVLNDGVNVPQSYLWRGGAWNGVALEQIATQISATQPPVPTMLPAVDARPVATQAQVVPGNCTTAVAVRLSAEEAARHPDLDRDGDGVACYGD